MNLDPSQIAISITNHISAMVAYWDAEERCLFSNDAYREWFGKTPEEMRGTYLKDLLGSLYVLNLPYIEGALSGTTQVFERRIQLPTGGFRDSITTYTPDIVDGVVRGFTVHAADVTILRDREAALARTLRERDEARTEVRTLRGLLSICSSCKHIRDDGGQWQPVEKYVADRTDADFTHGICPDCAAKLYPNRVRTAPER